MKKTALASVIALCCFASVPVLAATPDQPDENHAAAMAISDVWAFGGGELKVRFNDSLLDVYGMSAQVPEPREGQHRRDALFSVFDVTGQESIQFSAAEGSLTSFVGGLLRSDTGFTMNLPNGKTLDYSRFQVRVNPQHPYRLDLVGADGRAWFYVTHLMWEAINDGSQFHLRASDITGTQALADHAGVPELAGQPLAELRLLSDIVARSAGDFGVIQRGSSPNFHGDPHPDGGTYEADVLMQSYNMVFMRCRHSSGSGNCDGNGPDDGEVVFAPNSTLRNTNNPNTADIPWYEKFTGHTNPYGYPYPNADQHPYLIWSIYRITDDQLEQIATSGVKHAWLTTNTGCASPFGGHILSPNCQDTYGTGNNDYYDDLGPREEIVPAAGHFGRCESIFDTNCDGVANSVSSDPYRDRLIVRESQLSVADATYYSDSWYIVQDDINIYNTMMHRTMTPTAGGSGWIPGTEGTQIFGPVINTWVDPDANPTRNVEIATDEGHTRIAVNVKELDACPDGSGLSGTCYRYDYVVNNLDFARAVYGDPPNDVPPNLRVVSNNGFESFSIPVPADNVHVGDGHFADLDIDSGNDWTAAVSGGSVTWTAPEGNELNWGTLYRFSFVANLAPDEDVTDDVALGVAGPGEPSVLTAAIMVPEGNGGGPASYVVTASAGTGGSIDPDSQDVVEGDDAHFEVTPDIGFVVVSVEGDTCTPDDNGDGTWTAAEIMADCAVEASFKSDGDLIFYDGFEGDADTSN